MSTLATPAAPETRDATACPRRAGDVLSADEIKSLTALSDVWGALAVLVSWGIIAASLALAGFAPSVWTVAVALVLLGGRQLGLSILMHEASHRSLFRTRALNDVVGKWLCAAPVWGQLAPYRAHHLRHHNHANSPDDPDLGLVTPFPASTRSVARKFARDLLGWTGVRRVLALVAMDLGLLSYTASTGARRISVRARGGWRGVVVHGGRHLGPVLVTNAALALLLWAAGIGWTYLLWLAAYLTTFSLFVRIRAMAEHACTAMDPNPFLHTRTTHAGILARLTVAPHHVNYHLEHHLLMTVPHQSLPRMHRMLQARQAIPATSLAGGYMEVLRRVTGRAGDLAHVSEGR